MGFYIIPLSQCLCNYIFTKSIYCINKTKKKSCPGTNSWWVYLDVWSIGKDLVIRASLRVPVYINSIIQGTTKPLELTSDNLCIIYLYADHSPQLIKSKYLYLPRYRLDRMRANKNTTKKNKCTAGRNSAHFSTRCVIWNCYTYWRPHGLF